MTQMEGIAYIKGVLEQVKARSQAEKLRRKQRDQGRSQLMIPLADDHNLD